MRIPELMAFSVLAVAGKMKNVARSCWLRDMLSTDSSRLYGVSGSREK